jgi:nucleolar protein 12
MLPRKLRVMRAKAIKKRVEKRRHGDRDVAVDRSMQGRASKLLGRAGAAQARKGARRIGNGARARNGETQAEGGAVFEGHRARANDRVDGLKVGRKKSKGGKPSTRSTKRAIAWRKKQDESA